jgi:deoxyxylulose-5-phosphate synthase
VKLGGVASAIEECFIENKITDITLYGFEFDDIFLPYGKTQDVEKSIGFDTDTMVKKVKEMLNGSS